MIQSLSSTSSGKICLLHLLSRYQAPFWGMRTTIKSGSMSQTLIQPIASIETSSSYLLTANTMWSTVKPPWQSTTIPSRNLLRTSPSLLTLSRSLPIVLRLLSSISWTLRPSPLRSPHSWLSNLSWESSKWLLCKPEWPYPRRNSTSSRSLLSHLLWSLASKS